MQRKVTVILTELENDSDFPLNGNLQPSLITPAHPGEAGSESPEGKIKRQQKFHGTRAKMQLQVTILNPHLAPRRLKWSQITAENDFKVNIYKSFFVALQIQLSCKGRTSCQQIEGTTILKSPCDVSFVLQIEGCLRFPRSPVVLCDSWARLLCQDAEDEVAMGAAGAALGHGVPGR